MTRRLLAALICGVLTIGVVACGRAGDAQAPPVAAPRVIVSHPADLMLARFIVNSTERQPPLALFTAADAVVPSVHLYDAPGAATPSGALSNPTIEGAQLVMLVKAQQGDWLDVQVPSRPNERTAWIHASDVSLRMVATHIVVEVGAHRLTAYDAENKVLLQEPVAVGQDRYPTPLGTFFVDAGFTGTGGAYGVYMLSVAGYSNVLETFGGGVGQIAIHGTNQPGLIGQSVSHGCVRMTNDAISRLRDLAPTGTPVTILA